MGKTVLMTGHRTGNNNSAEYKLNDKGREFAERIAARTQEDIDNALKNDKILIKDKIKDTDFHFCLFCSQPALQKYVELIKIEDGYYGCPDCNFTKVTQEAYDQHLKKSNKENNNSPEKITIKKDKKLKEKILDVFKSGPTTIEEISKYANLDKDTIRSIINRNLKNKYIKETGEYKSKFKVYDLIAETEMKQEHNRILKDLKKGFKSFNSLFLEITKRIKADKTLTLEDYKFLKSQYINENLIISINKKLQEEL